MIDVENIHSLTDFKRNASRYVDRVRDTQSPLVLTVNGKAAVVVQDAIAFQDLVNRCEAMAAELQELKRETLRQDIQVGIEQLENGQYSDHSGDELDNLFDEITRDGREQIGKSA